MKWTILLLAIVLFACNNKPAGNTTIVNEPPGTNAETAATVKDPAPVKPAPEKYSNARFREVIVENAGGNKYRIRGQGQIFEASFNWKVEDGHEELLKGYQMTDAGAPEWGNFDFTIDVQKKRENSTLTLILFESSAKDGSPQHELPIALK
jgi:hypothetical protein